MSPSVLTVCLMLTSAFCLVEISSETIFSDYKLNSVQNLTEFLNLNPGIKLQPLIKQTRFDPISSKVQIIFTWGNRKHGNKNIFLQKDVILRWIYMHQLCQTQMKHIF